MPDKKLPKAIEEAAKKHAGTGWKLMDGSEEYNVPQYDAFKAGYSLAIKELEGKDKEINRIRELLREVCVRANIIFPEREEELDMFDEKFKGQSDLFLNLNATLGLGEMDEESKIQNEKALKAIQSKHNL